jgi:hypothetical protein
MLVVHYLIAKSSPNSYLVLVQDASSAAGLARDKLMERGQKLQVTIIESQICDKNSIRLPWVKILQYIL